jgi:hypothetical protein
MRKVLSIIGVIFVVLVLVGAGFVGFAAYQGRGLDASSKAYVEENIPAIISTWSKDEFLSRASPQLLKIIDDKPGLIDLLFKKFVLLGAMKSFGDVKGDSNVFYSTQNGKVVTANYTATAKFENGDAQIAIRLIQTSGKWQLLLFNINSPLFLQ